MRSTMLNEKRMVAILPPDRYQDWIEGSGAIGDFMMPFSADLLHARAEDPRPKKRVRNSPIFL
jgi:hypothetical protein